MHKRGIDRAFYKLDRERVWNEQHGRCYYCKELIDKNDITFDHVIPISKTKFHSTQNCVVACRPCNQKKAAHAEIPKDNHEDWEILLNNGLRKMDEMVLRMMWKWDSDHMGSFNRWRKYWMKRRRF